MADGDVFVGSNIRVRTYLYADLTNIVLIEYYWEKPTVADPDVVEEVIKVANVEDAQEGIVYYDTLTTDFNVKGEYKQQVKTTDATGGIVWAETGSFHIKDRYE